MTDEPVYVFTDADDVAHHWADHVGVPRSDVRIVRDMRDVQGRTGIRVKFVVSAHGDITPRARVAWDYAKEMIRRGQAKLWEMP